MKGVLQRKGIFDRKTDRLSTSCFVHDEIVKRLLVYIIYLATLTASSRRWATLARTTMKEIIPPWCKGIEKDSRKKRWTRVVSHCLRRKWTTTPLQLQTVNIFMYSMQVNKLSSSISTIRFIQRCASSFLPGKRKPVETQVEDDATTSDSDDDDLSLTEAPRKKSKHAPVVSSGDSDNELDCILNSRVVDPPRSSKPRDTAALEALAYVPLSLFSLCLLSIIFMEITGCNISDIFYTFENIWKCYFSKNWSLPFAAS